MLILPYSASSVQGESKAIPTLATEISYPPSQVFNLTNWKLTLPIGLLKSPAEIKQPELGTYKIDPWFIVAPDGGVRFRAPVNGVTTGGSNYPRSELRYSDSFHRNQWFLAK